MLWNKMKERYDYLQLVHLSQYYYDWIHLRSQHFKLVSDYNSESFRISSKLLLYEEKITDVNMLDKTFSTFQISNMLLRQQYREESF